MVRKLYPKYLPLFMVLVNFLVLLQNFRPDSASAGERSGKESRSIAVSLLRSMSESPFERIKSLHLTYDVHLEREWNIRMKTSAILRMEKSGNKYIASFRLSEPAGDNLWGKVILYCYGRHTAEYAKMMERIDATICETFRLKRGRFFTDELKEILPEREARGDRAGLRVFFDYNEARIKFWKDRNQKECTTAVEYTNQVGPLTAYFNLLFFGRPEVAIHTINLRGQVRYGRNGNRLPAFGSKVIKLQHNNTDKHNNYNNIASLGSDDFFELIHGEYIYYNSVQIPENSGKAPYAAFVEGIVSKSKKREKDRRLKRLREEQRNHRLFDSKFREVQSMSVLSAKNVEIYLREARVIFE